MVARRRQGRGPIRADRRIRPRPGRVAAGALDGPRAHDFENLFTFAFPQVFFAE